MMQSNREKEREREIERDKCFAIRIPKTINIKLTNFLEFNKIFPKIQFGIREGISIEQAIVKVTSPVYNTLHKNKKCATEHLGPRNIFRHSRS